MSEHGTLSKYTNDRCRCELCRKANSIASKRARERRKMGIVYQNLGRPKGVKANPVVRADKLAERRIRLENLRKEMNRIEAEITYLERLDEIDSLDHRMAEAIFYEEVR